MKISVLYHGIPKIIRFIYSLRVPTFVREQNTMSSELQQYRRLSESEIEQSAAMVTHAPEGTAVVYIIKAGPFFKVGHTTSMAGRMASLRSACPYPAVLLAVWVCRCRKDAKVRELKLHDALGRYKYRGEWFTPGVHIDMLIDRYRKRLAKNLGPSESSP